MLGATEREKSTAKLTFLIKDNVYKRGNEEKLTFPE